MFHLTSIKKGSLFWLIPVIKFWIRSNQRSFYCDFNSLPFVEDSGNFTIQNVNVGQNGSFAEFLNTPTPRHLTFVGSEPFNLQGVLEIEVFFSSHKIAYQAHTLLDLSGATSYLVIQHNGLYATYTVYLTGSTGGNTDDYAITGSNTFFGLFQGGNLKLIYNPSLGTLQTYVNDVLDIDQTGITPRVNETRTLHLSSPTFPSFEGGVDYFRVQT